MGPQVLVPGQGLGAAGGRQNGLQDARLRRQELTEPVESVLQGAQAPVLARGGEQIEGQVEHRRPAPAVTGAPVGRRGEVQLIIDHRAQLAVQHGADRQPIILWGSGLWR